MDDNLWYSKKTIFLFTSRTIGAAVNYTKHRHLDFFTWQFYGQTSLPAIHLNLARLRCSAVTSQETKLFTWESNPARRITRLTRYLHSTTHSRVSLQVFCFTCKLITCNLTVCVGRKLGNTTNIFSSVFRAATTSRIARHLFAYIFGITNCMQICTRGNKSQ